MLPSENLMWCRIYVNETDRWHHQPLAEALVLKARDLQLAGATAVRAFMGFGHSHQLHTTKILRLSDDLPIVVELVDTREKLEPALAELAPMLRGKLVTTHPVQGIHF